jgi:hypothetical protein
MKVLIRNDTGRDAKVRLTAALPPGWKPINGASEYAGPVYSGGTVALTQGWEAITGAARYPVAPRDVYPAQTFYVAPAVPSAEPETLTWTAQAEGNPVGTISVRVYVGSAAMPQ